MPIVLRKIVYLKYDSSPYPCEFGRVQKRDVIVFKDEEMTDVIHRFKHDDPFKPHPYKHNVLVYDEIYEAAWPDEVVVRRKTFVPNFTEDDVVIDA